MFHLSVVVSVSHLFLNVHVAGQCSGTSQFHTCALHFAQTPADTCTGTNAPVHTDTHKHTNGYTQLAICVIVFYMSIISF